MTMGLKSPGACGLVHFGEALVAEMSSLVSSEENFLKEKAVIV